MTDALNQQTIQATPSAGEEELRFIRNFHDIFLSIGLGLFALGLTMVTSLLLVENVSIGSFDELKAVGWSASGAFLLNAAIMWGLAEFFARNRRLFLPAIVILIAFAWHLFLGASVGYVTLFGEVGFDVDTVEEASQQLRLMPLIVSAIVTLGVVGYYLRMKLPFASGLAAASAAVTIGAGVFAIAPNTFPAALTPLQFFAGLMLFALGISFDARDPSRRTRFADNAFWMHFFAAPLIYTSVMTMTVGERVLSGSLTSGGALGSAIMTLVIVTAFALVSLLINRRALLVAGLLSAAAAVAVLVNSSGLSGAWTGAMTLLLLGGAMVLLGGGWHAVRRVLVAPFPKTGLIARIVPPEPSADEVERASALPEASAA